MNIHPTAVIAENTMIGENFFVGAHSVIAGPPEHRDYWNKEYGTVIIGNNVRISNLVTVDSGTTGPTFINDNCVLLAHSHVGHDAIIGEGSTISCGAKIGGGCIIGKNVTIGLNATIHQGVHVPDGCMIGMNAVITKATKLFPYSVYVGNPAKYLKANEHLIKRVACQQYPELTNGHDFLDFNYGIRRNMILEMIAESEHNNRNLYKY